MIEPRPIIDTAELARRLDGPAAPIVLAVATESEFRWRRIPGSHRFGELDAVLATTGPTHPIVVSGRVAGNLASVWAFRLLREMGFSDVVLHDAGVDGWAAAGLPVEGDAADGGPASPTSR